MTFREFFLALKPEAARATFAKRCGSTLGYFKLLASGHATAGPDLAIRIEDVTDGVVKVETIRPDVPWHVVRAKPSNPESPAAVDHTAGQETA